jgi:hypothetical protein
MKLKTLKVFDTAIEAHILKNSLEGEGIEAFIFDEHIVTLNPLLNFAVGGIRVQVKEEMYKKAIVLVHEMENRPLTDEQGQAIQCPNCEALDLYSDYKTIKDPKGLLAVIFAFIFSVFPVFSKSVYKCKICNTEFEKS